MDNEIPKSTTRRRPVSAPKKTKEDLVTRPTVTPNDELPEITPEEAVSTAVESQEVENKVIEEQPDPIPTPVAIEEKSDEDWAREIEAARKAREQADLAARAQIQNEIKETTPTSTVEDPIEAEVQRRVAEKLKQREAEEKAHNPLLTAEEKASAANEASGKSIEELHAEIAEKNNASHLIYLALGDEDDFIKAFEAELADDARPDSQKVDEPTPYAAGMALARQIGQKNNQQRLAQRMIKDLLEKNNDNLKEIGEILRNIKISRVTPKIGDGSEGPKKLTGTAARAAVVSRMKGMYRVHLYNSGFWVDLRKPSLMDIDSWMQEVDTDFKEIGRVLGGHSHSVIDIFLKQKFMEILPQLVQRSNFEEWQDANALISNISFHDYDVLLWAFCCMMYKDGIGAGIYCTNPECKYIDDNQYIDLRNICFINTEAFNPEAIGWMQHGASSGSGVRTAEDLQKYREQILHIDREISLDNGKTVYELKVPTMREFIEEGTELMTRLTALVNGERDITSDAVSNQLTFHLYKMLTPWIKTLKVFDDVGNLVYLIEDRLAIYESLDVEQFEEADLYRQVSDYIRDTKIAFFSSTTLQCPKCGKKSSPLRDNMTALDMEYLFFCLSCLMLEQTGATL